MGCLKTCGCGTLSDPRSFPGKVQADIVSPQYVFFQYTRARARLRQWGLDSFIAPHKVPKLLRRELRDFPGGKNSDLCVDWHRRTLEPGWGGVSRALPTEGTAGGP